ncbi:MAG: FAD-dependent oxidoreductase [Chlorobiaceae bacterium]|nr:FAD-dependent oxidoreductase [Chlorobiaceae bacterium]
MRVAVIGGGISGIASAYYLKQRNIAVDLYESAEHIGGRIGSELLLERWVDFGGKNIGSHYRLFREFARVCGNPEFEYFGINTSQLVNGRVIGISKEGARRFNMLRMMSLCGVDGVCKLYPHARTILKDRRQGVLGSEYFTRIADRYDHLTLADYLKKRCVNHVVRPITIRMNGAEPDECYPGNFGSNLALALDSYEQLRKGMHSLLDAVRFMSGPGLLRISEGHQVTSISNDSATGLVRIGYVYKGQADTAVYDRVISALPALRLASVLEENQPEAASLLRQIRYFPVAVAIVKYQNEVFRKNRRAMVFDQSFPLSNVGAYGINDLDLVRYTFSGRVSRSLVSENSRAEEVIGLGEQIASPYFSLEKNPREAFVYRYLAEGLCAYSSRHHMLLEKIDRALGNIKDFAATGDYRRGASIEACFRAALECVDKVIGVPP